MNRTFMNRVFNIQEGYALNITLSNKPESYFFKTAPLDGGTPHSQLDAIELLHGRPETLITGPEFWTLFEYMHDNRNNEYKTQIEALRQLFVENEILMTGTCVLYQPKGPDKIIHGVDTKRPRVVRADIAGMLDLNCATEHDSISALIGATDFKKMNEVFAWLTGKDVRVHMKNLGEKPHVETKRALTFDLAYNMCLDVGGASDNYLTDTGAVFGWRRIE